MANDNFDWRAAMLGDVNGDGFADLIIGNPGRGTNGRACVYRGGSPMDSTLDLSLVPVNENFGYSIAALRPRGCAPTSGRRHVVLSVRGRT